MTNGPAILELRIADDLSEVIDRYRHAKIAAGQCAEIVHCAISEPNRMGTGSARHLAGVIDSRRLADRLAGEDAEVCDMVSLCLCGQGDANNGDQYQVRERRTWMRSHIGGSVDRADMFF
jgi:hypothetical protein